MKTLSGTVVVPSDLDRISSDFIWKNKSLPLSLDWRAHGLVSEVKMQVRNAKETSGELTCKPANLAHQTKRFLNPPEFISHKLEGDWMNRHYNTFKQANQICHR